MKKNILLKGIVIVFGIVALSFLAKGQDEGTTAFTKELIIAKPGEMVVVENSANRTFLGIATRNACKPSTTACRLKN